jgi:hypothetical protein
MKKIWLQIIAIVFTGAFVFSCDESGMNDLPQMEPELLSFGVVNPTASGVINRNDNSVVLEVPVYADITSLVPRIHVSYGSQVDPPSDEPQDFTNPVTYTITNGNQSVTYTVTVKIGAMDRRSTRLLVLGVADDINSISNQDERAAATWAISTFDLGRYMSFGQLQANATVLEEIDVVWWHYDTSYEIPGANFGLPAIAMEEEVIQILTDFRNNGGGIYLSGFATQYLDDLGVVNPGDGPNEVGGASTEFDNPDNWGMSFKGHVNHPVFKNLRKADQDVAFLISGGASRKDNKAWWAVHVQGFDFPDYGTALASVEWDKDRNILVIMGEFQGTENQGKVIGFSAGAYDWYSSRGENTYIDNVRQVTENILTYLATQE